MSKKIVLIVVLIECILAVLLISVFGQAIYNSGPKLVTEIYFTYENGEKIEDGKQLVVTLTDSKRDYQLYWEIDPENASDGSVKFTSSEDGVVVDSNGKVTFIKDVLSVVIMVESLDGGNKRDAITLKCNIG